MKSGARLECLNHACLWLIGKNSSLTISQICVCLHMKDVMGGLILSISIWIPRSWLPQQELRRGEPSPEDSTPYVLHVCPPGLPTETYSVSQGSTTEQQEKVHRGQQDWACGKVQPRHNLEESHTIFITCSPALQGLGFRAWFMQVTTHSYSFEVDYISI